MFYKMPWIRFLVFSVVVNLPPLAASANQSPVPVVEALFGEVAYLGPAPCQSPCEIIYQQQQVVSSIHVAYSQLKPHLQQDLPDMSPNDVLSSSFS